MALVAWLPGLLLLAVAPIPMWASILFGLWLAAAVVSDVRAWSRRPVSATWRPGRGWLLEWAGGRRRPARLLGSSRILPWAIALTWSAPPAGNVRLLFPARPGDATARRLRVLMRYGRGDG